MQSKLLIMNSEVYRPHGRGSALWLAVALLAAGCAAQVAPFLISPNPARIAEYYARIHLPAELTVRYDYADCAAADEFNRPYLPSNLASNLTVLFALAIAAFGCAGALEKTAAGAKIKPVAVAVIFTVLFVALYILGMPGAVAGFFHYRKCGMTGLSLAGWFLRIGMAHFPIDLALFALRAVLIYAALNVFKRGWRLACPLLVFIVFNLTPELIPLTPVDPAVKLTRLSDGPYRESIERVAQRAGMQLELMVEDTSKREEMVNMYLGGRSAARRLVMTDTFMNRFTPEEAAVGAGHELGHLAHDKLFLCIRLLIKLAILLVAFQAAFALSPAGAAAPVKTTLKAFFCVSLATLLALPLQAAVSRHDEQLADRKALEYTGDAGRFGDFLVKGAKLNRERLEHKNFLEAVLSDHPSIMQRIRLGRQWLDEAGFIGG